MLLKICIALLAFDYASAIPSSARRFDLVVYGITCTNHTAVLKRLNCAVKHAGNSRYLFSVNLMSNQKLAKNTEIRALINVKMGRTSKTFKFLDLTLNLCDALSSAMIMPFAKNLMDEARRTGNLPYVCPLKQNYLYYITNYTLTASTLPAYATFLNFTFELNTYHNGQLLVSAVVKGATVPKS